MRLPLFRILSCLMLLGALCIFSGLVDLTARAAAAPAADSCCDREGEEKGFPAGDTGLPCQSAECPCLTCMALVTPEMMTLRLVPVEQDFGGSPVFDPPPAPFVASIDQPPETV